jgi:hypothetical protein
MKPKSIKISILFILFFFIMASTSYSEDYSPQHQKIVQIFQSNEEPTAKDAVWTAFDIFKVGVINDGSIRDGYAQYVCQVLYDHGFKGKKIWVQIIDIITLNKTGKWVKLGEAYCE